MGEFRYKAFISYSWADAAWGKWLHHALETYRTPRQLVGSEGLNGPVPARLHPLFKDREEEAAGASIGAAVESALAGSEFLIVICSPNSVRSRWVDHEIAWFKAHREPGRILALIVDGEPDGGERECFPRALTHLTLPDLTITDQRCDAPLAADARATGDGKRGARLKLAAALLGVGLDGLVRRDDRRRALRQRWVTAGSVLFGGSMAALAWLAVQARDEADFQRAQSDGLVEFMLTDLREKLEPVGRLDALDVVGQRALKYYAGQKPGNLDADALGRRSRALHLVGEVRNIRGDSAAGLIAFRQAAATTQELLARDPGNAQRVYDHAQSVFWVGYIAYERGENKEAEAQLRAYKRLADQLMAIDPNKPEWQMEVSYAETNLGVLLFDQGRFAEAEPAFANAVAKMEAVTRREKVSSARQKEMGKLRNWLGKARAGTGRIGDALKQHQSEISLYDGVLKSDPRDTEAQWLMAIAWQHVGELELVKGNVAATVAAYRKSLILLEQLRLTDPANTEWQESEIRALNGQAGAYFYSQNLSSAWSASQKSQLGVRTMQAADPKNRIWALELRSASDILVARIQLARGEPETALATVTGVLTRLANERGPVRGAAANFYADAGIVAGDALDALARRSEARHMWRTVLDGLPDGANDRLFSTKRQRFLLLKRLGMKVQAGMIAGELERQGDKHPAFLNAR